MGQVYSSFKTYTYKELQVKYSSDVVIINTLPLDQQKCLIQNTLHASKEIDTMNELLSKNRTKIIIIYGKNNLDMSVIHKYNQLKKLGFTSVYIYFGGMFEWALLNDIYGATNFPTTSPIDDPLRFG
jgi:hypothetical protein